MIYNISVDTRVAAATHSATAHSLSIAMKVLLVAVAVLACEVGVATTLVVCLDVG